MRISAGLVVLKNLRVHPEEELMNSHFGTSIESFDLSSSPPHPHLRSDELGPTPTLRFHKSFCSPYRSEVMECQGGMATRNISRLEVREHDA
jgi:hypothetical protein